MPVRGRVGKPCLVAGEGADERPPARRCVARLQGDRAAAVLRHHSVAQQRVLRSTGRIRARDRERLRKVCRRRSG